MIGPADFTMNDESGIVIEGHEREPMVKQPWHPPYYQRRCEEAGLEKAVDLLMWELDISDREQMLPIIFQLAEQIEERHGVVLRRMSRRSLRRDMDLFAEIYNEAWSENWGFSPTRRRTSTTTPRSCSSSSTRTGSWSPRRRRASRSRSRSPSPTSTRCSRR